MTPGGVDVNYAGPSTHGPAPSSTGGGGLACLNEQEQARIRELYDASRSLDEPMEKEVGWRSFLTSFSLTQPRMDIGKRCTNQRCTTIGAQHLELMHLEHTTNGAQSQ